MSTVTLKKLHTEGRLSIGDTLNHDTIGDCELVRVTAGGALIVKDKAGALHSWELDLPAGCRVVPARGTNTPAITVDGGTFVPEPRA